MSRLPKLSPEQAEVETREVFQAFIKERGRVPKMFRTVVHRPEILRTMTDHLRTVMTTGPVERRLKELISVRVSHLIVCDY